MNRKISPNDELAIDAFLAELHGQPAPDLSKQILAQWSEISVVNDSQADAATASRDPGVEVAASRRSFVTDKPSTHGVWKFAIAIAAIAAAVLVFVWIGRDSTNPNGKRKAYELAASDPRNTHSTTIEPTQTPQPLEMAQVTPVTPTPDNSPNNASGNPTTVPDPNDSPKSAERKPLKGIPLAMESSSEPSLPDVKSLSDANEPKIDAPPRIKVPTIAPEKLKAVTLVAKQIDTNLHDYWSSIGIEAAQEAEVAEITQRLSSVLEITVPESAIESAESFERFLSDPEIARGAASQFMTVVTEGGFKKLDPENQSLLVKELANCFESNQPFDETLAAWISGDSENSLRWYSANADDGVHPLARRLATLTMNVDVRCIKCHDSIIDSRGTQSEYWAFTGLLERSVTRKNKKVVSITTDRTTDDLVFFETLEGLQKVVEAGVPAGWIAGSGNTAAMDLKQWSQRVVGSRELARGVVNSMWRMIHGRPLRGSVVDLSTPPHTESLGSLERRLVDDLIDSRFNIARTLALVVSTPSTRRSVPLPLRADQIAMASQAEIDHGNMLVGAFAATAPQHASLPVGKRVRFANQSVGISLDAIRKETMLLAQTLDASNSNAKPKKSETKAPAKANVTIEQFPANAAGPPVQWLTLIDDLDQKVNHLAYLVPMQQVPKSVTEVVDKMVTEKTAEPLILHRVWWMIHP